MKPFLIAFALLYIAPEGARAMTEQECADKAQRAESIMYARQMGEPLEPALEVLSSPSAPHDLVEVAMELLLEAYQQPRLQGAEEQRLAVSNFRDKVFASCLAGSD